MTEYPHLENAPIVEALIDIQVQLPSSKTVESLQAAQQDIKNEFPKFKKRFRLSASLKFQQGKTQTNIDDNQVDGFLFTSTDENKMFQCRLDGFTFNKHKPYENWESLRDEAKKYWEIYKNVAEPVTIKRIAVRYINKISLKTPFDPSNYFKTLATLSSDLDYDMFNLFSQIRIYNKKIEASAIITQAIENIDETFSNFVFDIDVFKISEFKEEEIWTNFEYLRDFKNEIFFKSITDNTLRLLS